MSQTKVVVSLLMVLGMFFGFALPQAALASSTDGIYLSVEAEPTVTGYSPVLVTVKLHNPTEEKFNVTAILTADEISRADVDGNGVVNLDDAVAIQNLLNERNAIGDVNHDGQFNANDLDLIYMAASEGFDINGDALINNADVAYAQNILNQIQVLNTQGDVNGDGQMNNIDVNTIQLVITYLELGVLNIRLSFANVTNGGLYSSTVSLVSSPTAPNSDVIVGLSTVNLAAGTYKVKAAIDASLRDGDGMAVGSISAVVYDTFRIVGSSGGGSAGSTAIPLKTKAIVV